MTGEVSPEAARPHPGRRTGPERSCVGCRRRRPKGDLLRVVRGADGGVSVDRSGAAPGRGAYVCGDGACVRLAVRRGGLARALRLSLRREDLATLEEQIEEEIGTS